MTSPPGAEPSARVMIVEPVGVVRASLRMLLAAEPDIFGESYVSMVAAGEAGGILDTILKRLATYIEKADALKRLFTVRGRLGCKSPGAHQLGEAQPRGWLVLDEVQPAGKQSMSGISYARGRPELRGRP